MKRAGDFRRVPSIGLRPVRAATDLDRWSTALSSMAPHPNWHVAGQKVATSGFDDSSENDTHFGTVGSLNAIASVWLPELFASAQPNPEAFVLGDFPLYCPVFLERSHTAGEPVPFVVMVRMQSVYPYEVDARIRIAR